jgi:carbon storage regulator CsrA
MLVLSRRAGEKIVFPNIGVTVEVVKLQGNVAKIGVNAPPSVRVLRHELKDRSTSATAELSQPSLTPHELNNRLNQISLAMHLFRRQRAAGLMDESEATLASLLQGFEEIDYGAANKPILPACRTLVVDDDANERGLLAGLLNMNGCECATAADGFEALDYLRNHDRPDVILLDMHMPRCDGPNTLRAIRDEPRLSDLRIFGVSGTSPQDLGIAIGPAGIDGWFPKPLNPRQLWETLQKSAGAASVN